MLHSLMVGLHYSRRTVLLSYKRPQSIKCFAKLIIYSSEVIEIAVSHFDSIPSQDIAFRRSP